MYGLARIPTVSKWTPQPLERALICAVDESLLISSCSSTPQTVPRKLPLTGNPLRIAHLEHLHKLVVGVDLTSITQNRTRCIRPGLEIIDIDPSSIEEQPKAQPHLLGCVGERITCISNWTPQTQDKRYGMVVIGTRAENTHPATCDGRLIFMTVEKHPQGLKVKHKRTYRFTQNPIYSLAPYGNSSLIVGLGQSLLLQTLDFTTRKWQRKAEYRLLSPALNISVVGSQIQVMTACHSMLSLRLENDHFIRIAQDQQARKGTSHVMLSSGPVLAAAGPLGTSLIGFERDQHHGLKPLFEARLSRNISRLRMSSTRSTGASAHEIFFASTIDGVVYRLQTLSDIETRLLHFVQGLQARDSDPLLRSVDIKDHIQNFAVSAVRPSEMHIDGDRLSILGKNGSDYVRTMLCNDRYSSLDSKEDMITAAEEKVAYFDSLVNDCLGETGDAVEAFLAWIRRLLDMTV